jgi:hypothetical protein
MAFDPLVEPRADRFGGFGIVRGKLLKVSDHVTTVRRPARSFVLGFSCRHDRYDAS